MRKISSLLLTLLCIILVSGCGGSVENVPLTDETSDEVVEEVPGRDTTLALYPRSVRFSFEESEDNVFLIQYWVPASLEDVIDFYKEQYPEVYQFEGGYADGEYTFYYDGRTDSGEIETFAIEIDNYYENWETESMVNLWVTKNYLR